MTNVEQLSITSQENNENINNKIQKNQKIINNQEEEENQKFIINIVIKNEKENIDFIIFN